MVYFASAKPFAEVSRPNSSLRRAHAGDSIVIEAILRIVNYQRACSSVREFAEPDK
jgi:hypothetical protein